MEQPARHKAAIEDQANFRQSNNCGGKTIDGRTSLVASLNLLLGGVNSRHPSPRRLTF